MALFNRLFSKKKNTKQGYVVYGQCENNCRKPFSFSKDQVRVLLFRECDWRGRKLLFDSKSVVKVNLNSHSCKLKPKCNAQRLDSFVEVSNGYGYQYTRPEQDTTTLGEMIFGAVAMTLHGSALKVHVMKSPSRIMCTKIFHAPVNNRCRDYMSESSLEDSCGSSVGSINDAQSTDSSDYKLENLLYLGNGPLDVPCAEKSRRYSIEGDSGFCGESSLNSNSSAEFNSCHLSSWVSEGSDSNYGSIPVAACHSGGSLASLQRRWNRNMSTSLEMESIVSSLCNSEGNEDSGNFNLRRAKLGLAILISLTSKVEEEMETFCFDHISVIESVVERLRHTVDYAYRRKSMFVHLMMEGCDEVQKWIEDLFSAPRVQHPIWLSLTSTETVPNSALAYTFLQDICHLLTTVDTKSTNFFVSTLVTAVLTYHLGWVNTVFSSNTSVHFRKEDMSPSSMLHRLGKSHAYNPFWGQLGDLYGAVCNPTKIAKTIVTSGNTKKNDLLKKILITLTYFIRCGSLEIKHAEYDSQDEKVLDFEPVDIKTCAAKEDNVEQNLESALLIDDTITSKTSNDTANVPRDVKDSCKILNANVVENEDEVPSDESVPSIHINNQGFSLPLHDPECLSIFKKEIKKIPSPVRFSANTFIDENVCSPACAEWEKEKDFPNIKKYSSSEKVSTSEVQSALPADPVCREVKPRLYPSLDGVVEEATDCLLSQINENLEEKQSRVLSLIKESLPDFKGGINSSINKFVKSSMESLQQLDQEKSKPYSLGLGLKRASSFTCKLEDIVNEKSYPKLYPNLDKIILEEGIQCDEVLEVDQSYDALTENSFKSNICNDLNIKNCKTTKEDVKAFLEISGICKRNNLSQQSATIANNNKISNVLFEEKNNLSLNINTNFEHVETHCHSFNENILPEKVGIEYQKSSYIPKRNYDNIYSSLTENSQKNKTDTLNNKAENVVFILGDEKLVDVKNIVNKSKSDSVSTAVKEKNVVSTNSPCPAISDKVVTVHPSLIELEKEDSSSNNVLSKQCNNNFCRRMSFPSCNSNVGLCSLRKFSSCYLLSSNARNILYNYNISPSRHKLKVEQEEYGQEYLSPLGKCISNILHMKNVGVLDCKSEYMDIGKLYLIPSLSMKGKNSENDFVLDKRDSVHSQSSQCPIKFSHLIYGSSNFGKLKKVLEVNRKVLDLTVCKDKLKADIENKDPPLSDERLPCTSVIHDLPLPRFFSEKCESSHSKGYAASFLGGVCDHYVTDLVLQGCMQLPSGWEAKLRRDLTFSTAHNVLDQDVFEAVCVVANTDNWDVQLVSSHMYVVDKPGMLGVRLGMSQLVANMLESLLNLWKSGSSPEQCLMHLESKLRDLCLKSQTLAELLLTTEFCDMQFLTSSLDLDANDIPLLLAIASTHTPLVTEKYGLSFR